jgi:hypothetical protein
MKSLIAALSALFVSCMALDAYSLTMDLNSDAHAVSANADAAMTPDAGTTGVGE